ncbi:MAG: type III pantothenate kinase [Candidatus Firestonebacteria bacterium]|nr:type III pantothenate kinase [Candidatus Firestonebacteria bacterium]
MLLTVNVGNSNTRFGVFQGARLQRVFTLPTPVAGLDSSWKRQWTQALNKNPKSVLWEGVIAASVVPRLCKDVNGILQALTKRRVRWITSVTPMPVKNAYRPPRDLGVDRLLNAVAARAEFGAPVIMIDAGTAITVDAVDARGVFLGGAILPGLELSLQALARGTALVPRVSLKKPQSLLGRSTRTALAAGVVGGTAGALTALVAGLRLKVGPKAMVIGTGGTLEQGILPLPELQHFRPHLALTALLLLWQAGPVIGPSHDAP